VQRQYRELDRLIDTEVGTGSAAEVHTPPRADGQGRDSRSPVPPSRRAGAASRWIENPDAPVLGERAAGTTPVRQISDPNRSGASGRRDHLPHGDLTAQEWERVAPFLPAPARRRGRPYQDHRRILNGIFWILRTRASWRDLPLRYGSWHTCHDRLRRWRRQGLWDRICSALQEGTEPAVEEPSAEARAGGGAAPTS
jgi:hypothetical protein